MRTKSFSVGLVPVGYSDSTPRVLASKKKIAVASGGSCGALSVPAPPELHEHKHLTVLFSRGEKLTLSTCHHQQAPGCQQFIQNDRVHDRAVTQPYPKETDTTVSTMTTSAYIDNSYGRASIPTGETRNTFYILRHRQRWLPCPDPAVYVANTVISRSAKSHLPSVPNAWTDRLRLRQRKLVREPPLPPGLRYAAALDSERTP